MNILLEAGHGGIDFDQLYTSCPTYNPLNKNTFYKMAYFKKPIYEGQINREIVARISVKLNALNIRNAIIIPEFKDVSLFERVTRINNIYKNDKSAIHLSIHCNAFNGKASGFEVITYDNSSIKSKEIAEAIAEEMESEFPDQKMRFDDADGYLDKSMSLYMNRETDCPSVTIENFFFDNKEDIKILLSDEGLDKITNAYINAIKRLIHDNII